MGKVHKLKPLGFDPKKPDIFVQIRLGKDQDWIRPGRCRSIKEAKMKATAYGDNIEFRIYVNGIIKLQRKINKGEFPGRIAQAGYPTLGKDRP